MPIYAPEPIDLDAAPTPSEEDAADRIKPVDMRLGDALAKIPYSIQKRGVHIELIRTQLRARSRNGYHCHPGELSRALLKRGWTRRRNQNSQPHGQCVTLWYPPGVDPVRESIAASLRLPRGRPPKWLQRARQLAKESGFIL